MQFLKEKNIVTEYVLPIILFPVWCIIIKYITNLLFQIGTLYGTFFRGLFELIIKNI